jgi:hypothetical protein
MSKKSSVVFRQYFCLKSVCTLFIGIAFLAFPNPANAQNKCYNLVNGTAVMITVNFTYPGPVPIGGLVKVDMPPGTTQTCCFQPGTGGTAIAGAKFQGVKTGGYLAMGYIAGAYPPGTYVMK